MNTCNLQPVAGNRPTPPINWHPDGWCFRGVTCVLALAVSGVYGVALTSELGVIGAVLLIAAGLAWCVLHAGLWRCSPPRLRPARVDWCLWTMTVGSVAMALGLLAAAITGRTLPALLGGLSVADVAMGWVFTRYAPTVRVSRTAALLLWVTGMNGLLIAAVGVVWLYPPVLYLLLPAIFFVVLVSPVAGVLALAVFLGRDEQPRVETQR